MIKNVSSRFHFYFTDEIEKMKTSVIPWNVKGKLNKIIQLFSQHIKRQYNVLRIFSEIVYFMRYIADEKKNETRKIFFVKFSNSDIV